MNKYETVYLHIWIFCCMVDLAVKPSFFVPLWYGSNSKSPCGTYTVSLFEILFALMSLGFFSRPFGMSLKVKINMNAKICVKYLM